MIIIYHDGNKVVGVANADSSPMDKANNLSIAGFLVLLAKECPGAILVWCHADLKEQLNVSEIEQLFHHKKLLFSYNPYQGEFLGKSIGYVEESPFIKANKLMTFPTWQMSSEVGGICAEVLLALNDEIPFDKNFDYFLCSLAKLGMQKGLLCYSEPKFLKQNPDSIPTKTSLYTLFRFVKQHYRARWVLLLLMNLILYERKFPVLPFLFSLFHKNRNKAKIDLESIKVKSLKRVINKRTIDVIIPTIGRSDYLFDVLKDFSKQTHLPNKIIIVEQNSVEGSKTELEYIKKEQWPFEIEHFFTHQSGACNARNMALEHIENEWVFLADDDIRVEVDFMQKALDRINDFGAKAVTLKCFQKGEIQTNTAVFQWSTFGSGCSLVFAESLKNCKFRMGYEFGFGEDGDFGMQLRNQGCDVLYLPEPKILHLKAPVGGFRTTPVLQWQNDDVQPKPSPTIMLYQILHNTKEQTLGYKTILFFKYYTHQKIKNPIRYYGNFQRQWERSVFWANKLKMQNEI